jgi:hypothetical protein
MNNQLLIELLNSLVTFDDHIDEIYNLREYLFDTQNREKMYELIFEKLRLLTDRVNKFIVVDRKLGIWDEERDQKLRILDNLVNILRNDLYGVGHEISLS